MSSLKKTESQKNLQMKDGGDDYWAFDYDQAPIQQNRWLNRYEVQ